MYADCGYMKSVSVEWLRIFHKNIFVNTIIIYVFISCCVVLHGALHQMVFICWVWFGYLRYEVTRATRYTLDKWSATTAFMLRAITWSMLDYGF